MLFSLEARLQIENDIMTHVNQDHPEFTNEEREEFIRKSKLTIKSIEGCIERTKNLVNSIV